MTRILFLLALTVSWAHAAVESPAPGLTLETEIRTEPRPLRLYWLEANLQTPGVTLAFSPPVSPESKPAEVLATRPTDLLHQLHWKALVNGDAFWVIGDEKKRYPAPGDPLELQGYAVCEGKMYSRGPSRNNGAFYLLNDRLTMGVTYGTLPKNVWGAVGGYRIVLAESKVQHSYNNSLHPRTLIGFNSKTHRVYFLVIDGRQPGRSEGATEEEAGTWLLTRGATDALCLDGGGSSILVMEENGGARVVNRPVGVYNQPGTIRCIGNAVGLTTP